MSTDEEVRLLLLTMSVEEILDAAPSIEMRAFWLGLHTEQQASNDALLRRLPLLLSAEAHPRQAYADELFDCCRGHGVVLRNKTHDELNGWARAFSTRATTVTPLFQAIAVELAPRLQLEIPDILLEFFDAFCEGRPIRSHW